MTTAIAVPAFAELSVNKEGPSRYLPLAGRALYSAIFILAGLGHFSSRTIEYAAQSSVPLANLFVPAAGVIAIAGGISILLGYHARIGAGLIVLFLVPVTLVMHPFWAVTDPAMQPIQLAMFLKNLSMLGAALFIARSGAGPMSLDALRA